MERASCLIEVILPLQVSGEPGTWHYKQFQVLVERLGLLLGSMPGIEKFLCQYLLLACIDKVTSIIISQHCGYTEIWCCDIEGSKMTLGLREGSDLLTTGMSGMFLRHFFLKNEPKIHLSSITSNKWSFYKLPGITTFVCLPN